jgi:membrane protease YdiL (CAAX protease family)
MTAEYKQHRIFSHFVIIILTALIAQLIGNYLAQHILRFDHFYALWILLRIIIPIYVVFALRIPLKEIGLGMPAIDAKTLKILIVCALILLIAFAGIFFIKGYFAGYRGAFEGNASSTLTRFMNFMIFTSSTLTGWEFLHRGFILFGAIYVLKTRDKIGDNQAVKIAIAIVWIFEVVFHFIKPSIEAIGMLFGSPVLSYMAVRTRSIWVPFLLHLFVEILFITALLMQ